MCVILSLSLSWCLCLDPCGICCDPVSGDLYVSDQSNNAVRKISPAGLMKGTGEDGDGNEKRKVCFQVKPRPSCLVLLIIPAFRVDLFVSLLCTGAVSTVAGNGLPGIEDVGRDHI